MAKNLKLLFCILLTSICTNKAFAKEITATFVIVPWYSAEGYSYAGSMNFSAESIVTTNSKYNALKYVSSSYDRDSGHLSIRVTFDDSENGSMSLANTFTLLYGDNRRIKPRMQISSILSEQQSTDVPALDFYVTGTLNISSPDSKTYTINNFTLAHNSKQDKDGPKNWWIAAPKAANFSLGMHLGIFIGGSPPTGYAVFEQTGTNYKVNLTIDDPDR